MVTFFRRRERKLLARRATPGLRPQPRHSANYQNNSFQRFPHKPQTLENSQVAILCLSATATATAAACACCVPSRGPTGRCLRIPVGCLQSAEAGIRPGGRPPFLCATRKEAPIRAPQSATPSRCEGANLRRGACGVRRGTHCALRAPFGQPRRVSARSGRVLRHTRHPANTPPQAQPEGGVKPPTGHRCARPRGVQALRAAQAKPSRAQ